MSPMFLQVYPQLCPPRRYDRSFIHPKDDCFAVSYKPKKMHLCLYHPASQPAVARRFVAGLPSCHAALIHFDWLAGPHGLGAELPVHAFWGHRLLGSRISTAAEVLLHFGNTLRHVAQLEFEGVNLLNGAKPDREDEVQLILEPLDPMLYVQVHSISMRPCVGAGKTCWDTAKRLQVHPSVLH